MFGKSKTGNGGRNIKIVLILVFTFVFASLAIAQTEKPQTTAQNKIAVINSEAFIDNKTGIQELVAAYDKLDVEFKSEFDELKVLVDKIINLEKELSQLQSILTKEGPGCRDNIISNYNAKADEYKKLGDEFKAKQDIAIILYEKRETVVVIPIRLKIATALEQFRKEKGYEMILDSSKIFDYGTKGFSISYNDNLDITKEFINFYNENFSNTKSQ